MCLLSSPTSFCSYFFSFVLFILVFFFSHFSSSLSFSFFSSLFLFLFVFSFPPLSSSHFLVIHFKPAPVPFYAQFLLFSPLSSQFHHPLTVFIPSPTHSTYSITHPLHLLHHPPTPPTPSPIHSTYCHRATQQ